MDSGERWRSGRAQRGRGQEIRGKGVKGERRKGSAGVKRGELQSLKMRQRINKRTKMERGELKEEVSLKPDLFRLC